MDKPITISIEEFKQQISDVINNSGLHPFILDSILRDISNEIHMLYQNQIARDRKNYEESIKNESEKNDSAKTK